MQKRDAQQTVTNRKPLSLGRVTGMKHIQPDYRDVKPIPWYSSITDEFGSFLIKAR